ncbi:50S ribosomal protein L11 methyltransferase [Aminobacter aminovorans]|uniref:Ribosomal protein L11 methyltransferase n=1 Tax=Aminobacter aminovorans TaxID=83263 RepID=A0AAC8YNW5_AMIAI|nr:50S ribosomal protein L11 methyltransferase [Aminobacter aminovorans]AMS41748.1 50S ribosomal protein L11 methyltransferase [Aminobacter aminovorans]MBB3703904.1 ribosomal protein L11 methyltransferase [Aminobacter aminovorans]
MTQTRLHITTGREAANRIFAALETVFEEDGWPIAVIEIDEDRDIHEVSLYTDGDVDDIARRMAEVASEAGHTGELGREVLPDVDWVAKSLEGLKPVQAGRFIVHGSHDREDVRPGQIAIEIEAGLAFGTGHHGTTAGCLEMIEKVMAAEKPANALDLGTGSAVLAIAVAKLAPIPVLATDIDPVATEVAAANVRLNGAADHVETATAEGFDDPIFAARGPFDLIVANILAQPLMQLAPEMAGHLAANGSLVLSGILDRQHDAVVEAYVAAGFRHVETFHREGWVTIHLKN